MKLKRWFVAVAVLLGSLLWAAPAQAGASGCPNGSVDRGPWQINSCYHAEVSVACAFDARRNAREAYRISSGGTNWQPWATYNSGRYRSYLDAARAAVSRL